MNLLNQDRYQSGWGVSLFGNWGASAEPPHYALAQDVSIRAVNRLLAQYSDKPNTLATVRAMIAPMQPIFDAAQSVLSFRSLDTGFGISLDLIGDMLGLSRGGSEDNTYRIQLAGKAIANASDATPDSVRAVLDFLMQGLHGVHLIESPPGATILQTYELEQADGEAFARILRKSCPVATRVILRWELPQREGPSFGVESDNSAGPWQEWDGNPASAGNWAEAADGRGTL